MRSRGTSQKTTNLLFYVCAGTLMDSKTDADSSDVINNPRGVSPRLYLCTVCEKLSLIHI